LDVGNAVKSCLEGGVTLLAGWHCAFDSGAALFAGELKNPQNFKKLKNFSLLPSLKVILPPSLQFLFANQTFKHHFSW